MDCTTTFSNLGEILETGCKHQRLNTAYSRNIIRTTRPLFFAFIKIWIISIVICLLNSNYIIAQCQELIGEFLKYMHSSLFWVVMQHIAVDA